MKIIEFTNDSYQVLEFLINNKLMYAYSYIFTTSCFYTTVRVEFNSKYGNEKGSYGSMLFARVKNFSSFPLLRDMVEMAS